jgi:hypothetical protein
LDEPYLSTPEARQSAGWRLANPKSYIKETPRAYQRFAFAKKQVIHRATQDVSECWMESHYSDYHHRPEHSHNYTKDAGKQRPLGSSWTHHGMSLCRQVVVSLTLGSMRTPGLIVDEIVMRFK